MKILQVVHGFPPRRKYGTELYTYMLSRQLATRNEVHVFYPAYEGTKCSLSSFSRENITLHELRIPFGFLDQVERRIDIKARYKSKCAEKEFLSCLDAVNPDIIHFQHLIDLSASLPLIAVNRHIPIVLTLHDFWFLCPLVNLIKPNYNLCEGPDDNCQNCFYCWSSTQAIGISRYLAKYGLSPRISSGPVNAFLKFRNPAGYFINMKAHLKSLLFKFDRIVSPSKFLMNTFIQHGIQLDKIVHSPTGYDVSRFEDFDAFESLANKDTRLLCFGYVGGIEKHKGFDVLIEAFNAIDEKDTKLKIYGSYDPGSQAFKAAQSKVKNSNIEFMGTYEDVRKPFSEIDVLIFPSICYENRPLALMESILAGRPVIASNLGAIPEQAVEGDNALLFHPGNAQSLTDKIRTIVQHPTLLHDLRRNAKHNKQTKSIEADAEHIEKIYEEII